MSNSFYYLATPYSKYPDGLQAAFEGACKACAQLIGAGVRVYSPIAHTHPVAIHGGIDPLDHEIWLPADEPFMKQACGLIVCLMPTWDSSYGIDQEIRAFLQMDKPICYMEFDPCETNPSLRWPSGLPVEIDKLHTVIPPKTLREPQPSGKPTLPESRRAGETAI